MPNAFEAVGLPASTAGGQAAADGVIARFASEWLTPLATEDGYAEAEVAAAEARVGVRLPSALRATYRLFGRRDDLVRVQDRLVEPSEMYLDDEGQVLVFRTENQHVTWWGVPVDALHLDDPPVVFHLDRPETAEPGWGRFLERVSLACVEMVLSESLMGESSLCDNRELDEASVSMLERGFGRLGLPDYPLWAVPDGPPVRWFGDTDVLLRDDGRQWLWLRAKTHDALERVRRALPGDWLMATD